MRKHTGMRPQDIAILVKVLSMKDKPWFIKDMAFQLFLSQSEVSESLHRSMYAGLIDGDKKRVQKQNFLEFIIHGLRYAFPQQPGPIMRGMPTAYSHPRLQQKFIADTKLVWPDAESNSVGLSIEPFYPKQVKAAKQDESFYYKEAIEEIILPPYEKIAEKFDEALKNLLVIAPTWQSVDDLASEEDELAFVQAFRALLRIKNVLASYTDFSWEDLGIDEQTFENYKSKYLDLYDKTIKDNSKEKASILEDVDFELELIHRDIINVAYILKLLARLKQAKLSEREQQKKAIMDLMGGEVQLRSKRELIEKFIEENLPHIDDADKIQDEFEKYWQEQKILALAKLCDDEHLDKEQFNSLIEAYIFTGQDPIRDEVLKCLGGRPSILQAREIGDRIIQKMKEYVEVFVVGMAA